MKLLGITSVDFDIIDQPLIRNSVSIRYWGKNWSTIGQYISNLYIFRKPMTQ